MPEVIFTGPAGRLEGRYHPAKQKNAPIAMILHPHPQFHGTMNHQIVYQCYYAFAHRGFSVLRFNFRGVGRSQGSFDHGTGELSDAASALDWAQTINPEARACWVAGSSFGAWFCMQLLIRRPGGDVAVTGNLRVTALKAMREAVGFAGAGPYLAGGIVVSTSRKAEAAVKKALEAHHAAYAAKPVGVMVRSVAEMLAVLEDNP